MNLNEDERRQYSRHLLLNEVGEKGQVKLKKAKVLVIGAGGLSTPVLQYLTAAGVGRIGVIDDDVVDETNLQRQVLFTQKDKGKLKVESAVQKLKQLNPFIQFDVHKERLSKENVLIIFEPYEIIVDGTDNFPTRYLINDAAVLLDKIVVFGSIFKFDGQVSVFNYKNGPTYRCLYPTPPNPDAVPNCSDVGVLGILPGIIGSFQTNEVLKIILGIGEVLSGKLLQFDALSMRQTMLSFKKNPTIQVIELSDDYQEFCGLIHIAEVDFDEFKANTSNYHVLDVRTTKEYQEFSIPSLNIPLDELTERLSEIPTNKKLLVVCKSGMRSRKAIQLLTQTSIDFEMYSLKGGLDSIKSYHQIQQ